MAVDTSIFNEDQASALAAGSFDEIESALPLSSILPDTKVPGTSVSWTPNERIQQDAAMFATWNGNAPYDRQPGSGAALSLNLLPVRVQERIGEEEIIDSNGASADWLRTRSTDGFQRLGRMIAFRLEEARLETLVQGKFSINENGINGVTYDFRRDAALNNVAAPSKWTTASADPIKDVRAWSRLIEDKKGVAPGAMIVSRNIMEVLASNKQIKDYAAVSEPDVTRPTASYQGVRNAFANYSSIKDIKVLDDAYRDFAIQRSMLLPFNPSDILGDTVILLPALQGAAVGETAIGPTAENKGRSNAQSLYAHVSRPDSNQPTYELYATGTALPVLRDANSTLTAKVN